MRRFCFQMIRFFSVPRWFSLLCNFSHLLRLSGRCAKTFFFWRVRRRSTEGQRTCEKFEFVMLSEAKHPGILLKIQIRRSFASLRMTGSANLFTPSEPFRKTGGGAARRTPIFSHLPSLTRWKGAQPKVQRARAEPAPSMARGCPRHSGRDARATSDRVAGAF